MCEELATLTSEMLDFYFRNPHYKKVTASLESSLQLALKMLEDSNRAYDSELTSGSNDPAGFYVSDLASYRKMSRHLRHTLHDISRVVKCGDRSNRGVFPSVIEFLIRLIDDLPAVLSEANVNVEIYESNVVPAKNFLVNLAFLLWMSESEDGDIAISNWKASVSDLESCANFLLSLIDTDRDNKNFNMIWLACQKLWRVKFAYLYDYHSLLGMLDDDLFGGSDIFKINGNDVMEFKGFILFLLNSARAFYNNKVKTEITG